MRVKSKKKNGAYVYDLWTRRRMYIIAVKPNQKNLFAYLPYQPDLECTFMTVNHKSWKWHCFQDVTPFAWYMYKVVIVLQSLNQYTLLKDKTSKLTCVLTKNLAVLSFHAQNGILSQWYHLSYLYDLLKRKNVSDCQR